MIENRNVSIIQDEDGKSIVLINDKKFRGLSRDDWKKNRTIFNGIHWRLL